MNQNNTVCKNKDRNEDFRKLVQVQNSDHNTIKLVHMIIRDDHDLLSDFYSNKPVISSEVVSFLENGIKPLNLKKGFPTDHSNFFRASQSFSKTNLYRGDS